MPAQDRVDMNTLIGPVTPDPEKESRSMKWLATILVPLGAILFSIVDRFSRQAPSTSKYDLLLYAYIISVILLVAYEIRRPVGTFFTSMRLRSLRQRLDKAHLPKLVRFHDQMSSMLGDNFDNIPRIAREVDSWPEAQGANLHNYGYLQTLRNWHEVVRGNLSNPRSPYFPLLVNELSSMIYQMNDCWIDVQRKLEILINANKLPEHRHRQLRKDWAMRRETHEHFMVAWRDFSRQINREYRSRISNDYYPQLPPLT